MKMFNLIPEVSPNPRDPRLIVASPSPISYRGEPWASSQPRLRGRLVFKPEIDLNRYRCGVHVDWVYLHVRLREQTQSIWVTREITSAIGRKPAVLRPADQHDAAPWNHNGSEFRVKLQDPTMDELRGIADALDTRWGLADDITVVGIEVAVGFYPTTRVPDEEVDSDRHSMVAVIQRHHLPPWGLFSQPDEDLRFVYMGKEKGHTSFVVPDGRHATGESRSKSATLFKDSAVNKQILGCAELEYLTMPVDGTRYLGCKHGAVMFRVQNKIVDGSDPEARDEVLCLRKRRARVEVTLLEEGVRDVGIETLDDLARFDFVRLKTRFFSFWWPTFPSEPGQPLMKALHPVVMKDRRDAFLWGGCYLLDLCDRARVHLTRELIKRQRQEAPEIRLPERERLGKNGRLVAWDRLNSKIGKALSKFTAQWCGEYYHGGRRSDEGRSR